MILSYPKKNFTLLLLQRETEITNNIDIEPARERLRETERERETREIKRVEREQES